MTGLYGSKVCILLSGLFITYHSSECRDWAFDYKGIGDNKVHQGGITKYDRSKDSKVRHERITNCDRLGIAKCDKMGKEKIAGIDFIYLAPLKFKLPYLCIKPCARINIFANKHRWD